MKGSISILVVGGLLAAAGPCWAQNAEPDPGAAAFGAAVGGLIGGAIGAAVSHHGAPKAADFVPGIGGGGGKGKGKGGNHMAGGKMGGGKMGGGKMGGGKGGKMMHKPQP